MSIERDPAIEARRLLIGFRGYQILVAACRLKLPDLVADGPKTAAQLAAATETHAPSLRRLLRGLVAWRMFTEDTEGRFHSTAVSEIFQADRPGLRNMAIMLSEEGYLAWSEVMYSLKTGRPAFEHLFGLSRWEKLAQDPQAAADFNAAMVEGTTRIARGFVDSHDFAGVWTVVDVGGGRGALLAAVQKARPETEGILFDVAAGLAGAREKMEAEGLGDRVDIVEGSFFESVPSDADLYMLKSIVHDWDEEHALESCRRAMKPTSTLVLLERNMPERIDDPDKALAAVMSDLHMMVVLGG